MGDNAEVSVGPTVSPMSYVKPERLWLKTHPLLDERWLQDRIAEDPGLLGLGDLILKDRERIQPRAGRLDLLLTDGDLANRYEVEIQLGATDEAHIVRTIEYWDIERKRYPQYEHTAVLVAEDITSRFLNVIALLNGAVPLVAIQLNAVRIGDAVSLVFSTVVDVVPRGLADEDEEVLAVTNRAYWEQRANPATLAIADELLSMLKALDPTLELKYNKYYVGLAINGRPNNFVYFSPKKDFLRLNIRADRNDEVMQQLEGSGLDFMGYDPREGRYKVRLFKDDVSQHRDLLMSLFRISHDEAG